MLYVALVALCACSPTQVDNRPEDNNRSAATIQQADPEGHIAGQPAETFFAGLAYSDEAATDGLRLTPRNAFKRQTKGSYVWTTTELFLLASGEYHLITRDLRIKIDHHRFDQQREEAKASYKVIDARERSGTWEQQGSVLVLAGLGTAEGIVESHEGEQVPGVLLDVATDATEATLRGEQLTLIGFASDESPVGARQRFIDDLSDARSR